MKRGLVFFLGVIAGVCIAFGGLAIIASVVMNDKNLAENNQISWYDEPYETITFHNGVSVFQMLEDEYGLSSPEDYRDGVDVYLVRGEKIYDGKHITTNKYYIKGVYSYKSKDKRVRNVPVIEAVN